MNKAERRAEEAEDRERMARILKRHQKPAKKEPRREELDQPSAPMAKETTEH
jgi:hypothetical protein